MRTYRPEIAERLDRIAAALDTPDAAATLAREFPAMPKVPIDKAVMEHYPNVRVLEVVYHWNDVGDWRSLAELLPGDMNGNTTQGPTHLVETRDSIVIADEQRPIMTLGVADLVIIQAGGATLVARKDQLDKLKSLVEGLDQGRLRGICCDKRSQRKDRKGRKEEHGTHENSWNNCNSKLYLIIILIVFSYFFFFFAFFAVFALNHLSHE